MAEPLREGLGGPEQALYALLQLTVHEADQSDEDQDPVHCADGNALDHSLAAARKRTRRGGRSKGDKQVSDNSRNKTMRGEERDKRGKREDERRNKRKRQ